MARYSASGTTVAALANGFVVCSLIPTNSVNFKLTRAAFGVSTAGNVPTDFQVAVGLNRGTARGTQGSTATVNKFDPNAPAVNTVVDITWSVQPTLSASDAQTFAYNSRGNIDTYYGIGTGSDEFISGTATSSPIAFVHRSGAALPANHSITWTVEWEE